MRTASRRELLLRAPQLRALVRWEPALLPHLRCEAALSYSLFSREELAGSIPGPDTRS